MPGTQGPIDLFTAASGKEIPVVTTAIATTPITLDRERAVLGAVGVPREGVRAAAYGSQGN